MSVHDCLVGAAGTAAPPERTPIKNLPQMSQMRTDQEGMASLPYPPTKTPTDCTDVHRLGGKNAT